MEPHILSILPFILLLLSIAVLPPVNNKWWGKNYHFISISFGLITLIYYLVINKGFDILHSVEEYIMFISLLTSLFVISGGILIEIKGHATPLKNILLLLTGALVSNIIGTTGASMLLIRPYIKSNKIRITSFHIVFFIFIVSNIGGALTPIGDPPLFLGYLKGIPFFWITGKVFFKWCIALFLLLVIFYIFDRINFKKQPDALEQMEVKIGEKFVFKGLYNITFLVVVIISVFITEPIFLREAIMLITAIISYKITYKEIHLSNHFNFHPIKEVAWLFLGIFITITPALDLLSRHSKDLFITTPTQYYWYTGFLSAVLDNAPTYLTFLTASMGTYDLNVNNINDVLSYINEHSLHVVAISISAVFFGAMTYIGNGPNFMVKSIAEHQGIKTPSFLGFILKFSIPILLPIYTLIWWFFIAN